VAVANNAPPDTELIGIDISDRLFPIGEVGERIKCYKKSITLQPSTDWTGTFSFIHQRLLFGGLRQDEWPRAISNMYRMLKPGGYVQLGEIGVYVFFVPLFWSAFILIPVFFFCVVCKEVLP
jgi:hypothetical protein